MELRDNQTKVLQDKLLELKLQLEQNIKKRTYLINSSKLKEYYKNPLIKTIPPNFKDCSFDTLKDNGEILMIKEKILNEWDFEPITFLSSVTGSGKTHLACACAKLYFRTIVYNWINLRKGYDFGYLEYAIKELYELIDINTPLFCNESEIYGLLIESYNTDTNESERDKIEWYGKMKNMLIIDDMFASRQTEFARSKIYDIINLRLSYNSLPTIITSNLTLDQIGQIDNRIASRLQGKFLFEFKEAKDFRRN